MGRILWILKKTKLWNVARKTLIRSHEAFLFCFKRFDKISQNLNENIFSHLTHGYCAACDRNHRANAFEICQKANFNRKDHLRLWFFSSPSDFFNHFYLTQNYNRSQKPVHHGLIPYNPYKLHSQKTSKVPFVPLVLEPKRVKVLYIKALL